MPLNRSLSSSRFCIGLAYNLHRKRDAPPEHLLFLLIQFKLAIHEWDGIALGGVAGLACAPTRSQNLRLAEDVTGDRV